jgi:hypothetical protein
MQRNADFSSVRNLLILERETGFEPATSSLGIQTYVGSKSLARFCCEFLNLQHLVESAFPKLRRPNEAQSRQAGIEHLGGTVLDQPGLAADQTQRGGASMHWPCADSVRVRVYGGQIE